MSVEVTGHAYTVDLTEGGPLSEWLDLSFYEGKTVDRLELHLSTAVYSSKPVSVAGLGNLDDVLKGPIVFTPTANGNTIEEELDSMTLYFQPWLQYVGPPWETKPVMTVVQIATCTVE